VCVCMCSCLWRLVKSRQGVFLNVCFVYVRVYECAPLDNELYSLSGVLCVHGYAFLCVYVCVSECVLYVCMCV